MFRSLLILATVVCALQCTGVNAQGRGGKCARGANISSSRGHSHGNHGHSRNSYRSHYPSSLFGFSIGIGSYPSYGYPQIGHFDPYRFDPYVYDPYRFGSFEAPDLLNDPYFRERYRYDSRFPGRHADRYRAPLVVRPAVPLPNYESYRSATAYVEVPSTTMVPVDPADLVPQLRVASQQLSNSLSALQYGGAWVEYLAPHQISRLIAEGDSAELRELLTHYDDVASNPKFRAIVAVSGFAITRSLLRQYFSQPTESSEPVLEGPTVETLPLPEAMSVPDSSPEE